MNYGIWLKVMAKVLVNEFYESGWNKPIRKYAIHGGLIPPFTLEIRGDRYVMPGWYKLSKNEDMPNIKSNKVYKVKSSRGNSTYDVKMNVSGSMECTCPGYGFRRRCRHIDLVIK